jgi:hypothetical protein
MNSSDKKCRLSARAIRPAGLVMLLLLDACAQNHAIWFRNKATGEMVEACGPVTGLAVAVTEVERACVEAYEKQGWVRVPASE